MSYNFKTYRPFNQRGINFPAGVIRIRKTSLTISEDIMEMFENKSYTNENDQERVAVTFKVDREARAIQLVADGTGYVVQLRESGAGYLNTTRLGNFGLPVADYKLTDPKDLIFVIAE